MNPYYTARIMGVLNVTPDSFSDGGLYLDPHKAISRIHEMIEQGADIIDIGAESTRPDSLSIMVDEEHARLKPIVEYIVQSRLQKKVAFSIDTYKADIAEYALCHGFMYVNDVTALRGDPLMLSLLIKHKPYVIVMYSKDISARTTRTLVEYKDVVASIKHFLREQISLLILKGFPQEKIIIDPGMGLFISSDPKYSFEIIDWLGEFQELGYPLCIGISRKLFLGVPREEIDRASCMWSMKAISNGASIVRVHDVGMMREQLDHVGIKK